MRNTSNFPVFLVCFISLGLMGCPKKKTVYTWAGPEANLEAAPDVAATSESEPCNLSTVYFDFDQANLGSHAKSALKEVAKCLASRSSTKIGVAGHCDERGSTEYNLALGERRAAAVKVFLSDLGIAGSRISTVSYGEERPAVPGQGESAWGKNRRVELEE